MMFLRLKGSLYNPIQLARDTMSSVDDAGVG
jgi:hypothetical protein